jgi:hypothetical protein
VSRASRLNEHVQRFEKVPVVAAFVVRDPQKRIAERLLASASLVQLKDSNIPLRIPWHSAPEWVATGQIGDGL